MCWKSGFGAKVVSGEDVVSLSHGERMRSLEFGRREEEIGTPAGRERRGTLDRDELVEFAARAELFGLRSVVEEGTERRSHERGWEGADDPSDEEGGEVPAAAWGPWENSGLGFQGGLLAAGVDRTGRDTSEERRARLQASRTARASPTDLPLPATPQQPLSFSLLIADDTDPLISPRRARPHSLPPLAHTTDEPNSSSRPLSSIFDLDLTIAPHPDDDPFLYPRSSSSAKKPFSYKTHFKRAYLTESSWLRGPGRLLSTQMSTDDGVVTSLGVDGEWIVVGMATAKVHIFDSEGAYVKTLDGHELGVWCLVLVSKGGGAREGESEDAQDEEEVERNSKEEERNFASTSTARSTAGPSRTIHNRQFTNDSPVAHSPFFRHPRPDEPVSPNTTAPSPTTTFPSPLPTTTAPPPLRRRRKSFHAFGASFDEDSSPSSSSPSTGNGKERTGGMGLGAGGPTGDSSQQAGVCGTARGWGRKGATVVSGGCDRDVRVWDVESGYVLPLFLSPCTTKSFDE